MLSPEELQVLNQAKEIAKRKNCVVSRQGRNFKLYRKSMDRVFFIGQRQDVNKFLELVKKS